MSAPMESAISSTSTRLLLIRHGESTWNAEGRIQGRADPPLSELGRNQVAAIGRRLSTFKPSALYSSPAARTRETSAAIAPLHGLTPLLEPALLELHLGLWQGHRAEDLDDDQIARYRAWEHDPTAVPPPGGESTMAALDRIAPALERILVEHAGTTIFIVTHSIAGRVALSYLLGAGVHLVPRLRVKRASVSHLRIDDRMAILERLSDTAHLPPDS